MFAEVALSKSSPFFDQTYTYAIPDKLAEKVQVGSSVLVPFGKRQERGYVVGQSETSGVKGIKEIIEVAGEEPLFDAKGVALTRWIAEYYLSFFWQALKLLLPPGKRVLASEKEEKAQARKVLFPLTPEQSLAVDSINEAINSNQPRTILLHGLIGSGKTEVYFRSLKHILNTGKSAIVLVPEIGMVSQLVLRLQARFEGPIAILHSGLTDKQRTREWDRVARGKVRIVLGTRTALFAPLKNLGLIVIEDEHETSYKSDRNPRFHAREAALELAKLNNSAVVISSAAPSLETYHQAEKGELQKFTLTGRIDQRPLPRVEIVDMQSEAFGALSHKLKMELKAVLERGEQAILLVNRRGYFTFVLCKECGQTVECPHCSTPLNYFSSDAKLHCNLCGFISQTKLVCSRCHGISFKYSGAGTQRIEDEVAKLYPAVRLLRLDRDTVSQKGKQAEIFQIFSERKADVLIGTQIAAKGLDLEGAELVGVVSADGGLNFPDFRSGEKTFQLLTQAVSRAGRGQLPGKVIFQTFNPEHYAVQAAARQDYALFYRQEIVHRKELGYPPFSKLISLLFAGTDQAQVLEAAEKFAQSLRAELSDGILGPAQTVIPKVRGAWRYQILLKGKDLGRMRKAVQECRAKAAISSTVKLSIDVEPMGLS